MTTALTNVKEWTGTGAMHRIAAFVNAWLKFRRDRRDYHVLLGQNDHMLRDIGLTRHEVRRVSRMDFETHSRLGFKR